MKRFAVVLSGCGVKDGSEIHEAVLTFLAICRHGAAYDAFAPDKPQKSVVNHLTQQPMPETRNVMVESARIVRGAIQPLSTFDASRYDGLVFPGGFGAAQNLCTFARDGAEMSVDPDVERAVQAMVAKGKPIGALCIAPVILAKLVPGAQVTIGQDAGVGGAVESMGAHHVRSGHGEVVVDEVRRLFTTPCYMLDANIAQVAEGAENLVKAMMQAMK